MRFFSSLYSSLLFHFRVYYFHSSLLCFISSCNRLKTESRAREMMLHLCWFSLFFFRYFCSVWLGFCVKIMTKCALSGCINPNNCYYCWWKKRNIGWSTTSISTLHTIAHLRSSMTIFLHRRLCQFAKGKLHSKRVNDSDLLMNTTHCLFLFFFRACANGLGVFCTHISQFHI